MPKRIISDNAKTFQAGAKTLQTLETHILKENDCQKFLTNHGIKWQFITERAPWWGGFYERMIGLMKRKLKKTIGKASLNPVELSTVLTEIEAILNNRPLTYTYSYIDDGPPLTPSHFLCGRRLMSIPYPEPTTDDPDYSPTDVTPNELTKRWAYREKLMKVFWNQWRAEYLTSLRARTSLVEKKESQPNQAEMLY